MKNIFFEIHTNAPELNKVFANGIDITRMYKNHIHKLTKDHKTNLQLVRIIHSLPVYGRQYKLVATRPNGTVETRFCAKYLITDILDQLKQAKRYYSADTHLDFKPYFKY